MEYEVVIGLEAHAHLATKTKLFCGCSTAFGAPPNTQTCPVCTGQPGVLPVMNRQAVELALRTAVALHCEVAPTTILDRKNYYYPDLPKNYQISQLYHNLGTDGWLDLDVGDATRRVRIHNVHIEEDAGKLLHPQDIESSTLFDSEAAEPPPGWRTMTMVDLNRTGIPLVEIVSEPDMRSVEEARVYMETLAALLRWIGAAGCKMEEGGLRFEPSISLRPVGQAELGSRVEIKNVNSMKAVVAALEYEARRQADLLDHGEHVARTTMLWDENAGRTLPMRSKELAQDYRYFPEPDLVPIEIDAAWLERVRAAIPELPAARRARFIEQLRLPDYDAGVLVSDRALADYFEAVVREGVEPKAASNWILGSVLQELSGGKALADLRERVGPAALAELIALVAGGTVAQNTAKKVFAEMAETGKSATAIVEEKGLKQVSDAGELEGIVLGVLRDNPEAVADLRAGRKKAQGFLMGQVMRATKGQANPQVVARLIGEKLGEA